MYHNYVVPNVIVVVTWDKHAVYPDNDNAAERRIIPNAADKMAGAWPK